MVNCITQCCSAEAVSSDESPLCLLPLELFRDHIASQLLAADLISLELTCKRFSRPTPGAQDQLCVTEAGALTHLRRIGQTEAVARRWRDISWKERLHLELETGCGFNQGLGAPAGFRFLESEPSSMQLSVGPASQLSPTPGHVAYVALPGPGPRLLLSNTSTSSRRKIRWRLQLLGNCAIEFGVIGMPAQGSVEHAAMHRGEGLSVGFRSTSTQYSQVVAALPLQKGSIVEALARPGRVDFLVTIDPDLPEESTLLQMTFSVDLDVHLAATCWANCMLRVLHLNALPQ